MQEDDGLFDVEYADVLGIPFDFTAEPVPVDLLRLVVEVKGYRGEDALKAQFRGLVEPVAL